MKLTTSQRQALSAIAALTVDGAAGTNFTAIHLRARTEDAQQRLSELADLGMLHHQSHRDLHFWSLTDAGRAALEAQE